MSSFNRVILIGNLTRDPQVKHINQRNCVLSFSVGVNKKWRDNNGEMQQKASFPSCVAWNHNALFIERYFKKGDPILIEGEIQTRSYKDNEGNTRYATDVVVGHANFVGGGRTRRSADDALEDYSGGDCGESYGSAVDVPF